MFFSPTNWTLRMLIAQLHRPSQTNFCEYNKNYWIVHFKWVSFMVWELYLNKVIKVKKKKELSPVLKQWEYNHLVGLLNQISRPHLEILIKSRWYPRICISNKFPGAVGYASLWILWTIHLHKIFLLPHLPLTLQFLQSDFNFIILPRVLFLTSFLILMLPNQMHNFQFLILGDV